MPEDPIEDSTDSPSPAPRIVGRSWRTPAALERALDAFRPGAVEGVALHLPPDGSAAAPPALVELVPELRSWPAGAMVFASAQRQLIVLPPFLLARPQGAGSEDASQSAARLLDALRQERTIAVALLRLGRFAVGVFRGQDLIASKTDTRYVKGKHKAGGTSQLRFQRIREKQARELFDKTCAVARQVFAPYQGSLHHLALGGERHTLLGLRERCPYLADLGCDLLPRTLDVRTPNLEALRGCGPRLYESLTLEVAPPAPLSLPGARAGCNISP